MAHTIEELQYRQALPLKLKIAMTKTRIREWVNHYGQDSVAVSFSGGKDSTVLLHLVREEFPDIPAVYFDTGLEYPEIREFVKSFENVIWMKPKMNFRDVISKHGYPMISKEVSEVVYSARNYLTRIAEMVDREEATDTITTDRQTDRQTTNAMRFRRLLGLGEFSRENEGGVPWAIQKLFGEGIFSTDTKDKPMRISGSGGESIPMVPGKRAYKRITGVPTNPAVEIGGDNGRSDDPTKGGYI